MESETLSKELIFLIFKYLEGSNCQNAANALREEIAKHNLLPSRITWQGEEHEQDLATFESRNRHIPNDFLLRIVSRTGQLLNQQIPSSVRFVNTLLGSGSQSLLRTSSDIIRLNETQFLHSRLHHAPLNSSSNKKPSIISLITSRETSGPNSITSMLPAYMYEKFTRCKRSLGHHGNVHCVSFDRTGRFIITGANDALIKIWSAEDGRLLATLRGHSKAISDIAVNCENTMLATGSKDKTIRVWCLKTTATICVLTGHTGMITSLSFCPNVESDRRSLISTSTDGSTRFWKYLNSKQAFESTPITKTEHLENAKIIANSFSAGGSLLAVASTVNCIHLYRVVCESKPTRLFGLHQPNFAQVECMKFANTSMRLISGNSKGIANIWTFEQFSKFGQSEQFGKPEAYQQFEKQKKTLRMNETLPNADLKNRKTHKPKVVAVGWSLDDQYAITAACDCKIRVWESNSGKLKYILEGHESRVSVIESHPTDSRIFLSGGHDGRIFLWNLDSGEHIKEFHNEMPDQATKILDCKWSPDGSMFACTDSHGQVSIFTYERSDDKYMRAPDQAFFHTDYRPLIRNSNGFVIDEQTQCEPHLMPPPFLVDTDGNPYPSALQKLVPGREHCKDENQLVPIVQPPNMNIGQFVPALSSNELEFCYRKLNRYNQLEKEAQTKWNLKQTSFPIPIPIPNVPKTSNNRGHVKRKRRCIVQRPVENDELNQSDDSNDADYTPNEKNRPRNSKQKTKKRVRLVTRSNNEPHLRACTRPIVDNENEPSTSGGEKEDRRRNCNLTH